jgi:hypothetical protein
VHPQLPPARARVRRLLGRIQKSHARRGGVRRAPRRAGKGGIGHARQPPGEMKESRRRLKPGKGWGTDAIELFYDFRALMRSATSR